MDDFTVPAAVRPQRVSMAERRGVHWRRADWQRAELALLAARLTAAGGALAALPDGDLLAAWNDAIGVLADPRSSSRQALGPPLVALTGLSLRGLDAGLETVLGGVDRRAAAELIGDARGRKGDGLVLVVLAGNLPGLAVQPLLASLAVRRPVLLKSPSDEPLFAPLLVHLLGERQPLLGDAVAAICWPGGDAALEAPLLAAARDVLAYGETSSLASLEGRALGRVWCYGPKLSVALVGSAVAPEEVVAGLARDVALFDQRGCLSVQVVLTAGDPERLADALATALVQRAEQWPVGPSALAALPQVQAARLTAAMGGQYQPPMPIERGTVIVEAPGNPPAPGPGLRTVRIHPVDTLATAVEQLAGLRGLLQGAALVGEDAWRLRPALEGLGVSRCAHPGELQRADASWHNGGRHPLEVLLE